jgi:hypothetical protein
MMHYRESATTSHHSMGECALGRGSQPCPVFFSDIREGGGEFDSWLVRRWRQLLYCFVKIRFQREVFHFTELNELALCMSLG